MMLFSTASGLSRNLHITHIPAMPKAATINSTVIETATLPPVSSIEENSVKFNILTDMIYYCDHLVTSNEHFEIKMLGHYLTFQ